MNPTYLQRIAEFAINAHEKVNQLYDYDLPYAFHLRAAVREGKDFIHLLPDMKDETIAAIWLHDVIEDTSVSYNDLIKNYVTVEIAEMVRAVTNYNRGRNREERMPDYIYEEIRNTYNADFVKLADRLANVAYSKYTRSNMLAKYRKENDNFIAKVTNRHELLAPMINRLEELFK